MAYLNLLGYYEKDKDIILHDLLKSSIQNSVYTKHTYGVLKQMYEFIHTKVDYGFMKKNIILLKDRYGDYIEPCKSLCFEEKYFEKGFFFRKTYVLYIDSLSI